jgi:hypothetical protein
MTALRYILLVLHFIGLAAILGPALDQLRAQTKRITMVMVWGARAQILTGVALVGAAYANDFEPDNTKLAVKLLVALAIAGIAESQRKKDATWAYWAVGALTVVNIVVAVVWR